MCNDSLRNNDRILFNPITSSEIETVINSFKNNKAPGFDNVPAECYKHAGKNFIKMLTILFNMLITAE